MTWPPVQLQCSRVSMDLYGSMTIFTWRAMKTWHALQRRVTLVTKGLLGPRWVKGDIQNGSAFILCQLTVEFCNLLTGVTVVSEQLHKEWGFHNYMFVLISAGTILTEHEVQAGQLLFCSSSWLLLVACCLLPAGCVHVVKCFPRCWAWGSWWFVDLSEIGWTLRRMLERWHHQLSLEDLLSHS